MKYKIGDLVTSNTNLHALRIGEVYRISSIYGYKEPCYTVDSINDHTKKNIYVYEGSLSPATKLDKLLTGVE